MKTIHILHLEDNPDDANLIKTTLARTNIDADILWVNTKEKFEAALLNPQIDIILCDYTLPSYNGLDALKYLKEKRPDLPFILLSGIIGEEKTIEMFEAGVTDFILKNNLQRLPPAIERALNEAEEINKRKAAEKSLQESEALFRQFAENINEVFFRTNLTQNKVLYVSPAYEKIWGHSIEELYKNGTAWFDAILPEDQAVAKKFFSMSDENIQKLDVEYRIKRPDGEIRTIFVRASILKENDAGEVIIVGIAIDITLQAKFREQLKASLLEKEAMLKEIYHRVKNNLQVISSLLNLQARDIVDLNTKEIFLESAARVKSMALVHEMLYQSGNLSLIDMEKYIQELLRNLIEIYHVKTNIIKLIIQVDSVNLTIEDAIPCGLIINELISNALKYAFPEERTGEIKVLANKNENQVSIQISDNGIGLPSQIDFQQTKTLGMQLVNSLTKQINGTIKLDNTKGATFTLVFSPITRGQLNDKHSSS